MEGAGFLDKEGWMCYNHIRKLPKGGNMYV